MGVQDGFVLCEVGPHRLAFFAPEVIAVEAWERGKGVHPAHLAYALTASSGRLLRASSGAAVGVDSLEIRPEVPALLPAPAMIQRSLGGALAGFIHLKEGLWPVLALEPFAQFLGTLEAR